ncbi:MAG: type II and III secretion system protein family protein [Alphaproteobacteria bacterium]|nr:type II and III secretion system protein family protein [Alphaproteobacteria bacterium]
MKKLAFIAFYGILAASVACGPYAYSADAKRTVSVDLMQSKGQAVSVPKNATDLIVSDPDIVEVGPIKDDKVYLIGSTLGDTNVLVVDENGDVLQDISVHVSVDTVKINEAVKAALPNDDIKITAVGDQLILNGTVTDATAVATARDIVSRFAAANETVVNNVKVASNQQVMIQVKVVEVARNVLNELGIETDATNLGGHTTAFTGSTADNLGLTVTPSFGTGSLVFSRNGTGPITVAMKALERDGLVNTLAEPNLTAVSGENARFLAGGEFPAPSGLDSNGNVTYEYKPFGVSLSFKPIVMRDDRINLQISTEVSEVSTELTLELAGVTVPSFTVRRAETTVELASGGSLMIAGIIQSKSLERMNRLPGIGEVPILGALVRSESFSRNETELVVMITAYLVQPFAEENAERVVTAERTEPLNRSLVEALAVAYGESVHSYAEDRPFGYILE